MKLENLKPASGSTKNRKRIGRGEGSGKGGTATRGTKGAQARAGGAVRQLVQALLQGRVHHSPRIRSRRYSRHHSRSMIW